MAHYLRAWSGVFCAPLLRRADRQLMALFLTRMINDAARTAANGPSETRLYQTAAEGERGEEERGGKRGRGGVNRVRAHLPTP